MQGIMTRTELMRNLLTTTAIALTMTLTQSPALAQQIITTGDVTPAFPGTNPWNVGGNLTVGNTANGSLTVQNGGAVTSPSMVIIGNSASVTGQVTVDNGTLSSGWFYVGNQTGGQGNVLITNGGVVNTTESIADAVGIGQFAGSSGTVTLSNNSVWNSVGSIGVGESDGATGTLNILSGSKVNITGFAGQGLFVGNVGSGSKGTVLIDGAGSALNDVSDAFIGAENGTGIVTIQNGGLLHADGTIYAGGGPFSTTTANGAITVTGAGSTMTAGQAINVGEAGNGSLSVLNQAAVTAGGIFSVGTIASGGGTALVDGAGSSVTAASLTVGNAGTGTLTIADQAAFNAPGGTTIAAQAGSTGTLNIGAAARAAPAAPGVLNTPTVSFGSGTGDLVFNHTDMSGNYTFAAPISGVGAVDVYNGYTLMTGASTYSGPTTVHAGTLAAGGDDVFSPNSDYTVQASGALDLLSHSQTIATLTNAGVVSIGAAGGAPGATLTTGTYSGQGGSLFINTVLNAGGPLANQFTDRLLVTGNASGTTAVNVRASGSGAFTSTDVPTNNTGISIIQVAGTASADVFSTGGAVAVSGTPYQYHLNAYGPGSAFGAADPTQNLVGNPSSYWDYRLQNVFVTPSGPVGPGTPSLPPDSRPAVVPQVPAYITLPTALFSAGLLDIDQLHRRLGEIRDTQAKGLPQHGEYFVRGYGSAMNYTSSRSFSDYGFDSSEGYAAVQMGGSAVAIDDQSGTLRVGAAGSYGNLQFEPRAVDGWSKGDFNNYKISGIATYQARAGWYLDALVTGGWFDGTISTTSRGQAARLTGTSVGASLEGGYPITLGWQKLVFEPQVQVTWQHLMFGSQTDADGLGVNLGDLDQGVFRVGGRLLRPFESADGQFFTPYIKVNLLQGFADDGSISVSSVNFLTGQYGTAVQVGGGVTGMVTDRVAVYGDVAWQQQVSDGGFRGWALNGGVRYSF
jgi:outer membrane autotransporter protein